MIKRLVERYKQGIHPCMLWFLIQYYYDKETEAMYDGNHIITDVDEFPVEGRHRHLCEYGYQTLVAEFVDLNDEERQLLKEYIKSWQAL